MGKLQVTLGNSMAALYFIMVMWWLLLSLLIVPLGMFMDIGIIRSSGFATSNIGVAFIGIFSLFIGLSLLIPPFRKLYYMLPWMYPYVKILYIDVIIVCVGTMILNYGYQVQNSTRHTLFFVLMLAQIIVSRLLMCLYFSKRKVQHIGGDVVER